MSETIKKRILTATDISNITGEKGDILYDSTNDELVFLDGQTQGGKRISKTDHTHPVATNSTPGFMAPADKVKLDGLTGSTLPSGSSTTNPNTTVIRDGSSNFSANQITANTFVGELSGNATGISGNLSGDVNSSGMVTTLASVNGDVGTFGTSTKVARVTVDAKGRVTAASEVTITGAAPTGAAGGDLTGNFPNPSLVNSGVTAGTYGNSNQVAQITVNSKGIVTGSTNVTITGAAPTGLAGGDLTGNFPNPTVATVGGKTASAISTSVNDTVAATSTLVNSTLVKRDSNGKFVSAATQVGDPAGTVVTKSYVDALSTGGSSKNCAIYRINTGVQQVSLNGAAYVSGSVFNVPNNVSSIFVIIVSGGCGGSAGTSGFGAPGGNSGRVGMGIIPVTPGSVLTVTVGAGGAGGNATAPSTTVIGLAGGTSSITNTLLGTVSISSTISPGGIIYDPGATSPPAYQNTPSTVYTVSDFAFYDQGIGSSSPLNVGFGTFIPGLGSCIGWNTDGTNSGGQFADTHPLLNMFIEGGIVGKGGNGTVSGGFPAVGDAGNAGKIWIYY